MRPVPTLICAAMLSLSALHAPAAAQGVDPSTPAAAEAQPGAAQPAAGAGTVGMPGANDATYTGLPARTAQARTMRAYWHVFIAFGVTWVLLFGYALSVGRRFARLDEEVERLSRASE